MRLGLAGEWKDSQAMDALLFGQWSSEKLSVAKSGRHLRFSMSKSRSVVNVFVWTLALRVFLRKQACDIFGKNAQIFIYCR